MTQRRRSSCTPINTWPMRRLSPAVVAKRGDRAVGGNEQRQHVEPLGPFVAHQFRSPAADLGDNLRNFRAVPRSPIDERLAVAAERSLVTEKTWMGAGSDCFPV